MAGTAWATGTSRLAAGATASTYASELTLNPAVGGTIYKLVNGFGYNSDLYRDMQVARTTAQNFTIVVTLLNGAKFSNAVQGGLPGSGVLPLGTDVTLDTISPLGAAGAATFTIAAGGTNGASSVTFLSNITTSFAGFPSFKIAAGTNGWTIKDVNNQLATGPIQVTVQTFDAADGSPVDGGGTDTISLAAGAPGIRILPTQPFTATNAIVDVATNRQNFVATAPDTLTADNGASVGIGYAATVPLTYTGTLFTLFAADQIRLTFTSSNDFTGLLTALAPGTTGISYGGITATGAAATRTINVAGNNAVFNNAVTQPFVFTVTGTSALPTRTISVQIDVWMNSGGAAPGAVAASRNLQPATTVTIWAFNGSVLVANWLNGNSTIYGSRVYLWNPSTLAGAVTARLFTLQPVNGSTVTSTELTTPGSPLSLGTLAGTSAMNIKLTEDVLTPLAIPLPYTTNGGNLVLEITIRAAGVKGSYQVFKNAGGAEYGVSPLMVVQ